MNESKSVMISIPSEDGEPFMIQRGATTIFFDDLTFEGETRDGSFIARINGTVSGSIEAAGLTETAHNTLTAISQELDAYPSSQAATASRQNEADSEQSDEGSGNDQTICEVPDCPICK